LNTVLSPEIPVFQTGMFSFNHNAL
jgi:hypothetical protein